VSISPGGVSLPRNLSRSPGAETGSGGAMAENRISGHSSKGQRREKAEILWGDETGIRTKPTVPAAILLREQTGPQDTYKKGAY